MRGVELGCYRGWLIHCSINPLISIVGVVILDYCLIVDII